jgi:hypothetical protein
MNRQYKPKRGDWGGVNTQQYGLRKGLPGRQGKSTVPSELGRKKRRCQTRVGSNFLGHPEPDSWMSAAPLRKSHSTREMGEQSLETVSCFGQGLGVRRTAMGVFADLRTDGEACEPARSRETTGRDCGGTRIVRQRRMIRQITSGTPRRQGQDARRAARRDTRPRTLPDDCATPHPRRTHPWRSRCTALAAGRTRLRPSG